MVATRSKTRTSTGGDDHQPKIDDALEEVSTGRKRRTSKATKADGDAVAKKEPKSKKRKTEETAGEAHDQNEGQDDEKEVSVEAKDTAEGGAVEEISEPAVQPESTEAEKDVEMDEKDQEQHVEKDEKEQGQGAAIDSSRVDLEPNADKEEKNADVANGQAETHTENQAEEEKATGATDKQQVEEAEKEIVQNDNVTEYGTIHFLYKPKVEVLHPSSVDDVQRLHIILQPHKQDDPSGKPVLSRMLHIGRKVLPAAGKGRRQPFWAFVSAVAEDVGELHDALKESKNDTKTRGVRTTGADRLIASGPYCIVSQPANASGSNPGRRTSFLCYATTLPQEPGEVQKAFNIDAEGSFTISVKNPSFGDPPQAGLKEKAEYPEELQSQMGSLRWHAIDPPTYLDYPNAELLFIASHGADDIAHDVGEEIAHELEKIADEGDVADVPEEEMHKIEHDIQRSIYDMLKARGTKNVVEGEESLIDGTWV